MTGSPESNRVRALVDQLARGDRSTALALHALISAADAPAPRTSIAPYGSTATTTSPRCAPPAVTPSARQGD